MWPSKLARFMAEKPGSRKPFFPPVSKPVWSRNFCSSTIKSSPRQQIVGGWTIIRAARIRTESCSFGSLPNSTGAVSATKLFGRRNGRLKEGEAQLVYYPSYSQRVFENGF